jgi:peptide chain release factor subunit 1
MQEGGAFMTIDEAIRTLITIQDTEYPFMSLYLNTRWDNEQQRERVRIFWKHCQADTMTKMTEGNDSRKSLEHDLKRSDSYVEHLIHQFTDTPYHGIAVFACHALDTFLVYRSTVPFSPQFVISSRPQIRQLVYRRNEFARALVLLVATDHARIVEVQLGGITLEKALEREVPGRHKQGGWSQMRFQRHIKDQMEHHHKEVADEVTRLFDTESPAYIILGGQDHILASFKRFLPERLVDKMAAVLPLDRHTPEPTIVEHVRRTLQSRQGGTEEKLVSDLIQRALTHRHAVLGLHDTLRAALNKQVYELLLSEQFSALGWRCGHCGIFGEGSLSICTSCSTQANVAEVGEELLQAVLRQGGTVNVVHHHRQLEEAGGIGALLRY